MDAFQKRLERLAELAIRVGLNLEKGQEVIATAPIEAVDFVRLLAEKAYREGAGLFTVIYGDQELTRKRLSLVPEEALEKAPAWLYEAWPRPTGKGRRGLPSREATPRPWRGFLRRGWAGPKRRAPRLQARPRAITEFVTNWTIVPFAHPGWAKAVFPGLPEEEAVRRLWEAIFQATRADQEDPIAAWEAHNRALHEKVAT